MTVVEEATGTPTRHPAYTAFADVVERVLVPAAVEVDATEVPQSHLDALAECGFWGWTVPAAHGGMPVPPAVHAAAVELLFGACPSTALIASQHTGPIQHALRVGSPELLGLLPGLASGARIGAGAFGHVRSWPERASVTATRRPGGYRFDGVVPWLSGWGVVDVAWMGAVDDERREIVFALVDVPAPETRATPLRLAAIQGSRTVSVALDGLQVPAERVVQVIDVDVWKAADGTTLPSGLPAPPGPAGLARAALADALRQRPGEPSLLALAAQVEAAARTAQPGPASRAELAELAVRATTAAVVARGGAALGLDDVAQVRARAALFLQVRGLSPAVRSAELARWAR